MSTSNIDSTLSANDVAASAANSTNLSFSTPPQQHPTSTTTSHPCPTLPDLSALPVALQIEHLKLFQAQNDLHNSREFHRLHVTATQQSLTAQEQKHELRVQAELLQIKQLQYELQQQRDRQEAVMKEKELAIQSQAQTLTQQQIAVQTAHLGVQRDKFALTQQREELEAVKTWLVTKSNYLGQLTRDELRQFVAAFPAPLPSELALDGSNTQFGASTTTGASVGLSTKELLAQIEVAKEELATAQATIAQLQADLAKANSQLKSEQSRTEQERANANKLQQRLNAQRDEIAAFTAQRDRFNTERTTFYAERDQFQAERAQFALLASQTPSDMLLQDDSCSFSQGFLKPPVTHQMLVEGVINPALSWVSHFTSTTTLSIEYHFPQLNKSIHAKHEHYCDLVNVLFLAPESDYGWNCHWSHDRSTYTSYQPLLDGVFKSDTDSGLIPKLHNNPKLFFASPNIANGDWIQFYGPNAILMNLNAEFRLTVGALCDPKKKGVFTSPNYADRANGKEATSQYQISIKWEETE